MSSIKYIDMGLTITILLVGISGMFTFVNSFTDFNTGVSFDDSAVGNASLFSRVEGLQVDTSNAITSTANAPDSGLGSVEAPFTALTEITGLIYSSIFGWVSLVGAILTPFGLGALGTLIVSILLTIQLFTIAFITKDIIVGLLGRFG